MRADEPDTLVQHGEMSFKNRWYVELHSPDKYWTFMVSNNGRGQLIATSARPNLGMEVSSTATVPPEMGLDRRLHRGRE